VTTTRDDGVRRAWAWVDHLRNGGAAPWSDFAEDSGGRAASEHPGGRAASASNNPGGRAASASERRRDHLPGSQQLELLRRLNEAGKVPPALADQVLAAAPPGRGQPALRLPGVGAADYGARPVDPADVPADELLRVAAGVLAEHLVSLPAKEPKRRRPRRLPWHRSYQLGGDPLRADAARTELLSDGRRAGGRNPIVLLLGGTPDQMITDTYAWRILHTATASWRWWIAHRAGFGELPPRADLASAARHWAKEVGADRIRIVLDDDALPDLLGVRAVNRPEVPPAEALELVRHVNEVLRVLVGPERHQELLDHDLVPLLAGAEGGRLVVPYAQRRWVEAQSRLVYDELTAAGYAVVGDPARLVAEPERDGVIAPADAKVLALAVRTLLRAYSGGQDRHASGGWGDPGQTQGDGL
jgi:hypothetical protein